MSKHMGEGEVESLCRFSHLCDLLTEVVKLLCMLDTVFHQLWRIRSGPVSMFFFVSGLKSFCFELGIRRSLLSQRETAVTGFRTQFVTALRSALYH